MGKPVWSTPAGGLGTIPENVFYRIPLAASDPEDGNPVEFKLIAGRLPDGMQLRTNGIIEGSAQPVINVQGTPLEVNKDVTSQFAIRAYAADIIDGVPTIRISDRTFSITVTGQDVPDFITPAGSLGRFIDATKVSIPIKFSDADPNDRVRIKVLSGSLPPGLTLDPITGVISGVIAPLVGPPGTAQGGFDRTEFAAYPFDFSTKSINANFEFTLEITDGIGSNVRGYSIFVYARNTFTADNIDITDDTTIVSADVSSIRPPILLTPAGDLGTVRADNFYAFKFDAIDFDSDQLEFTISTGGGAGFDESGFDSMSYDKSTFSLPPGLQIDHETGWFYGYIPDQGAVDITYQFSISVHKKDDPSIKSRDSIFTITIAGDLDTQVIWLTPSNLGTINNGSISMFNVAAYNTGGRQLTYQIAPNTDSQLPPGLQFQPSGNITGRVKFDTFTFDGGTTTFDRESRWSEETFFDSEYKFTVNAYAPISEQIGYQVASIVMTNQGSGYTSQPTITISAPPAVADALPATAGLATISGGKITAINIGNPGRGYTTPPTVTITGGGGVGATAVVILREVTLVNAVSVFRTFTIRVNRAFNEPYQSLYIKAMPSQSDRAVITQLLQDQNIIPESLVYRPDDTNFGVSKGVAYTHAFGLRAASLETYAESLTFNHYLKNITLGEIKTAQAVDSKGNIVYEVIYSTIVDNLVNNQGQSVQQSINLPYTAYSLSGEPVATVYPNSLINMRNRVIDTVGQLTPGLPLWMTSKQKNGQVLGFVPAWVIAYVKPGESDRIAYNIKTKYGQQLNVVDFEVDRYELDYSQISQPTTEKYWESTDQYDKYLIFPKRTILG